MKALAQAGHHDPALHQPFPMMHELFSVGRASRTCVSSGTGSPGPGATAEHLAADSPPTNLIRPGPTPRPPATEPSGTAAPKILPGARGPADRRGWPGHPGQADRARSRYPYLDPPVALIGAKAGNLPGDLTFSWYAVDRTGQPWVVSVQLNGLRYHGPSVGSWMLQVAKQVFGLIHTRAALRSKLGSRPNSTNGRLRHAASQRRVPQPATRPVSHSLPGGRRTAGCMCAGGRQIR